MLASVVYHLHNLYASSSIRAHKSRNIRWASLAARIETGEIYTKFCLENLKGGDHLEDIGVDAWIILKWILKKQCGKLWPDFMLLGIVTRAGSCEHSNEPSGYIKGGEFPE
jgi:hypothetical protein